MELYLNFRFLLERSSPLLPSEIYQQIEDRLGWPLNIRSFASKPDGKLIVEADTTRTFPGVKKAFSTFFARLKNLGNTWNLRTHAEQTGLQAHSQSSHIPGLAATRIDLSPDSPPQTRPHFSPQSIVEINSDPKTRELGVAGCRALVLWAITKEDGKYRYGLLTEDQGAIYFLDEHHLQQEPRQEHDQSPLSHPALLT